MTIPITWSSPSSIEFLEGVQQTSIKNSRYHKYSPKHKMIIGNIYFSVLQKRNKSFLLSSYYIHQVNVKTVELLNEDLGNEQTKHEAYGIC